MEEERTKDSKNLVERDEHGRLKPGSILNPAGKPVGVRHLSTLLKEALKKVGQGEGEPADILIIRKLIEKAKRGEDRAIAEVFDRVDGKAPQAIDLSGEITKKLVKLDE